MLSYFCSTTGAKQAGLRQDYIDRLSGLKVYEAPQEIIELRNSRPEPSSLKPITVEELAEHKPPNEDIW